MSKRVLEIHYRVEVNEGDDRTPEQVADDILTAYGNWHDGGDPALYVEPIRSGPLGREWAITFYGPNTDPEADVGIDYVAHVVTGFGTEEAAKAYGQKNWHRHGEYDVHEVERAGASLIGCGTHGDTYVAGCEACEFVNEERSSAHDPDLAESWLAVWITGDGPSVDGPFSTHEAAYESILAWYMDEYGIDHKAAEERYETSGDEWVVKLK